ncbi:thiol-disulfide oxidoreductase DCC family protein [Roseateles sp. BYS78W]|uniref:Thiol-disulfide oxidoreductase DCC family protein n=1 Tax=Pelomonas candidula TaxID=3299025 RepID=A0ABW7HAX6_9BURK
MNAKQPTHTVYYDGACPLCRGEMELLMQRNVAGLLEFVDIATPGFDAAPLGVSRDAMLQLMHVRRRDGGWLIGVPAFEVIYAATGFHAIARWLAKPWFARLAAQAYPWLVRNRYRMPHTLIRTLFRVQERACPADGACRVR